MDQTAPRSIARRRFLRTAAGTTAGMASWLALRRAPAFAQKRELTFLSWNHFVPAVGRGAPQAGGGVRQGQQLHGAVDTIAHLQLPAKSRPRPSPSRATTCILTREAPIRSSTRTSSPTSDDIVDELGKKYGGWYPFCGRVRPDQVAAGGDSWFWISFPATYNQAHFKKAGSRRPPRPGTICSRRARSSRSRATRWASPSATARTRNSTFWSVSWSLRRQGGGGGRQDPRDQLREDGPGHRVVQGALQGGDGAGGPVVGRRLQQPLHALRQGLLDSQSDQPVQRGARQQAAHRRRHQSPQQPGGAGGHPLGAADQRPRASGSSPRTRSWPRNSSSFCSRRRTSTRGSWPRMPSTTRRCGTSPTIRSGRATRSSRCCPRRPSSRTRAAGRPSRARPSPGSRTTTSFPT